MKYMHESPGIIWDVDGTLIDTEPIQSQAFLRVLGMHGIAQVQLTKYGTVHYPGESTHATWVRLRELHDDILTDIDELTKQKRRAAIDIIQTAKLAPMPGVLQLLQSIEAAGIRRAVASTAQRERLNLLLSNAGLSHFFGVAVSGTDVDKHKPAPDAFLEAAKCIKVEPAQCVVIEDSRVGVDAAIAAGMKVVAVPNQATRGMDFSVADRVVDSLEDLSLDELLSLTA